MEGHKKKGRPSGNNKITDIRLIQLRRSGKTKQECAEEFGVTVSAIKAAEARIKNGLKNAPVLGGDTSENIDAMEQLKKINDTIIAQLSRCDKMFLREETRSEALDELQKKINESPYDVDAQDIMDKIWTGNLKSILAIQTNTINVSGEIRKQIELQLKIAETLYNIQMMQEFQAEIINLLKEVDPFVAQKLITKLKERRTIRGLVRINPS